VPDNERLPEEIPNPLLAEPEVVEPVRDGVESAPFRVEAPKGRRAAATFIFLTVTLDMLALGMIMPVLPRLITDFVHGNDAQAAGWIGLFGTLFAVMQFVFSPVLGSLSDRFGRRPVVLLSNFGLGMDYVVMALAPTLPWLFLTSSSVPTAMAYMADVTPPEKRAGAFGMLNAAFGIGFVLGPALGGMLGNHNPRLPFWVAGGLSVLNGMYGLFVLPESLPKANRRRVSFLRANPVGSLLLFLSVDGVLALAVLLVLGYLAQQSLMSAYMIYVYARYHWTTQTGGLSLMVVGICQGVYGALLVKPAVRKLGERKAMLWGYGAAILGYWMMGFSKTGLLVWLGIPVLNLMSIAWPAAQSLMSSSIPPDRQGELQGAVNSLRGIAGIVGPGLFTWIFARSLGPHPLVPTEGSPFYLAGALLLVGLVVLLMNSIGKRSASAATAA
jgi:DHA1 family tetracycline resistance protein-like MFS transporter